MVFKKTKRSRLDRYGLDAVCQDILNNCTMTMIAQKVGVDKAELTRWVHANEEREKKVLQARTWAAIYCEEIAVEGIDKAKNNFEMYKAREKAHHLRWLASKISPQHKDRIVQEHVGANDGPMQHEIEEKIKARPQLTADEWLKIHGLGPTGGTAK